MFALTSQKKFILESSCLTFLGLLLIPSIVFAQLFELEINQTEPDGPIPVFRNFPGKAGIIVQSSQTNLQFDSNLEVLDEQNNPNEGTYRVILEPVNQYVSVSAPGFMTSRIHLTNMEENEVRYYSIEPLTFSEGEASSENTFNNIREAGIELYDQGDFYFALDRFNDALRLRPDNIEVARYKLQVEDEIAWNDAQLLDSIESYQNYLNGSTLKQYADEAQKAIMMKYITLGETYVNNNNIELAEQSLNTYLDDFPSGPDVDKAIELLCNLYTTNGDDYSTQENLEGQKNALEFYQKAESFCITNDSLDEKLQSTDKLYQRYRNPTISYTMFNHDRISTYGITFGGINYFGKSGYFTIRLNEKVFKSGSDYTIDNEGNTNPPISSGRREFTGTKIKGNAEALIGINYPVYYPLWAYAGVGYSYNPVFWEMNNYSSGGNLINTKLSKNTDSTNHGMVFEFGAITHVNLLNMTFSLGLKGNNISRLVPTISFGFVSK